MRVRKDTMPNQVITHIDQVTTKWLTSALSKSEALTRGSVTSFELGTGREINERWIHVWLQMLKNALTACDDLQCTEL